jgi:hypothetical protein
MEALRSRLRLLSSSLSVLPAPATDARGKDHAWGEARLARLSATTLLALAGDASLHVLHTVGVSPPRALTLTAALHPASHMLVVAPASLAGATHAGGCVGSTGAARVAVAAPAALAIVHVDTSTARGSVLHVARALFERRPGLRILHVAWHPRAEDYLVVLTSDGSLRLFDVVTAASAEEERARFRVVTAGDFPVSFAFGKSSGWDALAVYVLAESGSLYVGAPIAPIGTRLSFATWSSMRAHATETLERAGVSNSATPLPLPTQISLSRRAAANGSSTMNSRTPESTPRRHLDFSQLELDDSGEIESDRDGLTENPLLESSSIREENRHVGEDSAEWTVRQARLQLRFLERAFERTSSGDMLMLRDFKPAPILFQGPLYIERDDVETCGNPAIFSSLCILDSGPGIPPILLRSARDGFVSVLVGMEAVEAQWFLSDDRFGTMGDDVIAANDEYSRSANIVAPAVLCMEHLVFPTREPVMLHPVRGLNDFDVLFARAGSTVFSVRLMFVSSIGDADALRDSPVSVIAPLLSTAKLGAPASRDRGLLGIAPHFGKKSGPFAIALTSDFRLEATAPLLWTTYQNYEGLPEKLITVAESSSSALSPGMDAIREDDVAISFHRARTGVAAEVATMLKGVKTSRELQTWKIGEGSMGSVGNTKSITDLLVCLETRVAAYTGAIAGSPGVGDQLKTLGMLLPRWADELILRGHGVLRGLSAIKAELGSRTTESQALQRKLRRVLDMNENLRARVATIREIINARQAALSPAEKIRADKLRERRKKVLLLRRRIEELSAAVGARRNDDLLQRRKSEAVGSMGLNNAIGRLSMSPLATRRGSVGQVGMHAAENDVSWTRLQHIKETLAQHTSDINLATERTAALWQQFASM